MKAHLSCKDAVAACLAGKRFTIALLSDEEKPMSMHNHDCLELYYSVCGGKQFFVNDRLYDVADGDLFIINQFETHKPVLAEAAHHERIVLSIHPDYPATLSTPDTDLAACFLQRPPGFSHRAHTGKAERAQFNALIRRCLSAQGFGADVQENALFTELLLLIRALYEPASSGHGASSQGRADRDASDRGEPGRGASEHGASEHNTSEHNTSEHNTSEYNAAGKTASGALVGEILIHINVRISQTITLVSLAEAFHMSAGYLSRLFKQETGTTISKYITARRISVAKRLLAEGCTVREVCERSGFGDYTHFIRAFGQAVGVSPKQYAMRGT